jgi:hypothetical protein
MLSVPAAAQFGAALLAAALAGAATDASASSTPGVAPNYTFPDGSKGFAFTTMGGRLSPEVLVEFNPQPDPPGFGGSRDITPGGGPVNQIATPLNDTGYSFLIALLDVGPDAMAPLPPAPNSNGDTGAIFMADGSVFRLSLNFAGPGNAIDWAVFNPQPDPPGIWFGAQFGYPAAGDPVVTFALTENERPLILSLASVPEAPAWALMIIGIGGVGALARSRTQTATARRGTRAA